MTAYLSRTKPLLQ